MKTLNDKTQNTPIRIRPRERGGALRAEAEEGGSGKFASSFAAAMAVGSVGGVRAAGAGAVVGAAGQDMEEHSTEPCTRLQLKLRRVACIDAQVAAMRPCAHVLK